MATVFSAFSQAQKPDASKQHKLWYTAADPDSDWGWLAVRLFFHLPGNVPGNSGDVPDNSGDISDDFGDISGISGDASGISGGCLRYLRGISPVTPGDVSGISGGCLR
jgi:hypothetical protein